ncbi:MAG: hypothetical protein ACOWW1_09710 [archaeon]
MSKKPKNKLKTKIFAVFLICISLMGIYYVANDWTLSTSTGYQTAFQGLQAEFNSIKWNDAYWSNTEKPSDYDPSSQFFGYDMNFDPDTASHGWCNLAANQDPIVQQTERSYNDYPYTWSVGDKTFKMDKVDCTWSVNIWLSGSEYESYNQLNGYPLVTNNYGGTELWIKLTPKTFSYFEGNPNQLYIAPAYIGLSQPAEYASTNKDGQIVYNDADMNKMDVNPSATGETLGIYYARGGNPVNVENEVLQYSGTQLDPEVFRNEYWIKVDLLNFEPLSWSDWLVYHKWKYPSVQLTLQITCFVVGEWTVYLEEGDVPALDPHTPPSHTVDPITNFFDGIGEWWDNPLNQVGFWLIVAVGVLVVLAIFVPTVLTMIFSGAGKAVSGVSGAVKSAKKKRRKKKSKRKN